MDLSDPCSRTGIYHATLNRNHTIFSNKTVVFSPIQEGYYQNGCFRSLIANFIELCRSGVYMYVLHTQNIHVSTERNSNRIGLYDTVRSNLHQRSKATILIITFLDHRLSESTNQTLLFVMDIILRFAKLLHVNLIIKL